MRIYEALLVYWYVPKTIVLYWILTNIGYMAPNPVLWWVIVIIDILNFITGWM